MERSLFDQMAAHDMTHWWYVARRKVLEAVIARHIKLPANARILEIGCGTGHSLTMLSRFGHVDATEIDAASRAIATTRLGRPVLDAALPELPNFADKHYDLIALLDVLEHLPEKMAFNTINETIRRRLKPGGQLLITVPAHQWMWSAHDVANHHTKRFSRAGLEELLGSAGYRIELLSYFNSLLFPLAVAQRMFGKLTGRESKDDALPPAPLNSAFTKIFGLEAQLVGRVPLTPGLSLIAIARLP